MSKTIKQIADELQVSKQAVWQRVKRSSELSAMLYEHSQTINGTVFIDEDMEKVLCELYPERPTTINVDETITNVDINGVNVDGVIKKNDVNVDKTSICKGININGVDINSVNTKESVDTGVDDEHANVDETSICKGINVDSVDINSANAKESINTGVDDKHANVDETPICKGVNIDDVDINNMDVDVNALIEILQSTVNTLKQQLTVKDKQIDDLSAMLKSSQEQQATLVTALSAAQALHAGTIQERLTEHSENSEIQREVNEAEQKSQSVKKGFFARIFRKGS